MAPKQIRNDFCRYVSLNVLGMVGLSCYILADTFFISNALGSTGLAALNLAISIYSIIHATGLMLGIGGATRYTILKSQQKETEANLVFTQTVMAGIAAGCLFLAIGLALAEPLARLLGADQDTLPLTGIYLRTILCFSPAFILNNIFLAFVRNDNSPRLSMTAMLTGSFANIILDYLFIFPLSMGMFGAAFATCLAPVISLGILSLHAIKKRNTFRLVWGRLKLRRLAAILSLGLSSFVTEVSSGIVLIVFNLVILGLTGNTGLAAYGIVANVALVATAVFTGIAQGIQPLASVGCGTNDQKLLTLLRNYTLALSLTFAAVIYGIVLLCSGNITAVFNSEGIPELAAIASDGFRLYFSGFFFAGINITMAAFLSASDRPGAAFAVSITRGCAAILPLILILPRLWGMNGVWLSFPAAELTGCAITVRALYYRQSQNK